jgi:MFS transporter, FSR family, fosmidomycin resistance protein
VASSAITDSPPTTGNRTVLLVTLFLGHALMHCFQQGWYILMPSVKATLGLSDVEYGGIDSTRALTGALINLPAGAMADLLKKQWVSILTSGLIGLGIAYFILGLAPSYAVVLLAAALVGISISLWHPPALATLSARMPDRLGFALSVHGMGGELGNTVGPLTLGFLIGAMAWQEASRALLIPMLVLAIAIWVVLRRYPGREGKNPAGRQYLAALRSLFQNRAVMAIVATRGVLSLGTVGVLNFFSLYMQRDLGFSTTEAGIYYAVLMFSGIFSQPVMGYLSDRFGRKAVIVPSAFLLGVFMMALKIAVPGVSLLLVAIGVGLFVYSLGAIIQAAAMDVTGEDTRAMTISMLFASSSLIGIPAPIIAGFISQSWGTSSVFLYSGIMVSLASLVMIFLPMGQLRPISAHQRQ